jgi:hypothetical protein
MKINIYCIEDINGFKYVGSTKYSLSHRLRGHKADKRRNNYYSSSKLDFNNSKIYLLEECETSDRMKKEKYWINKIDCVNERKMNSDRTTIHRNYARKNKDKINKYNSECYLFRSTKVINGCLEFIKMLDEY